MTRKIYKVSYLLIFTILLFSNVANAESEAIKVTQLDNLLTSIIKTVQLYSLPVMGLTLAFLGAKLIMSSDNANTKLEIKNTMSRILIGGFIVFGASSIASILSTSLFK